MADFVIVVDMQRDFVEQAGALPVPGAEAIVAPMQEWLASLAPDRIAGLLLTFDTHDPQAYAASAEARQFPIHCVQGTAGWESMLDVAGIDRRIPVYTLEKGVFDMWAEPGLVVRTADGSEADRDAFFDSLAARGIAGMTVVGVAADYCVRWAVDGLIGRNFPVTVIRDLTRGIAQSADVVFQDAALVCMI